MAKKVTKKQVKKTAAAKPKRTAAKKPATKKAAPKRKVAKKVAASKPATTFKPKRADTQTNLKPMEDIMTNSKTQYDQIAQDAAKIGQDTFEAINKSTEIFAKGFEEVMRASMGLAQEAAEKQAELMKTAMTSKSINDFTEFQNGAAKKSYDEFIASATKISEMSVKTLTEASEPIQNQMNKAIQKASQSMAA